MTRLTRKITLVAAAVALVAAIYPAVSGAALRGLNLGIVDDDTFNASSAAERQLWFDRTVGARANTVIFGVRWANVAPNEPTVATNPADPEYDWGNLDNQVREATARGLRVVLHVSGAPEWAEGPNRPSYKELQTWKPNPDDIADFGTAIATRYSGVFGTLPRVRYWQLWAEPNLGINLMPQTENGVLTSGNRYRAMQNAWYDAVKAIHASNFVITAGTSPAADLIYNGTLFLPRSQPIPFWRQFFCLQGRGLTPVSCPNPPKFDAIAHHPISVGEPRARTKSPEDVKTADLYKIKNILKKALATHRALPAGPKPFWATEIWWNSNPPADNAVSVKKQARWLAESFYLMWKQGVDTVVWFEIRDHAFSSFQPIPRCGLYFRDGRPKPALQAYRFPLVGERLKPRRRGGRRVPNPVVKVWGKAPGPGPVSIQVNKRGKKWKTVKTVSAGSSRVFLSTIRLPGRGKIRAKRGSEKSLPWLQKR